MAKYIVKSNTWISPVEEAGTLQNAGSSVIEISAENVKNTGIKLGMNQMISFSGTVYIRSVGDNDGAFTTVPFSVSGEGGDGSTYILPTASAETKGGVKIGHGLSMTGEVLDVVLEAPTITVSQTQSGAEIEVIDGEQTTRAVITNGQNGLTPTITFTDNQDGTYTLQSVLGQDTQRVVVHDGEDGLVGDDGKSAYDIAVSLGYEGTEAEWIASLKGAKGDNGESVVVSINDSVAGQHTVTFTVGEINQSTVIKDGDTEEWVSQKSYTVGRLVIYDGNIYKCITANTDSVFDSIKWQLIGSYPVYSSVETIIGTWADNKTLYQKTYLTTTPLVEDTFIKLFDLDAGIGTVIGIESTCTNIITGISDINAITDVDPVKIVVFDGGVYGKIYDNQQAGMSIYITLRYTK